MVEQATLDAVFFALSDTTRRRILERLIDGETTVTGLSEPFALTLAGVSKHIQVLERAKLVQREWHGRTARISLASGSLAAADHWLEGMRRFWEARLDALEAMLGAAAPAAATGDTIAPSHEDEVPRRRSRRRATSKSPQKERRR